jgi:hypothetical protein
MEMKGHSKENENWQVEVNGQVYETTLAELTQWIAERAVLETDLVKKGNLRWTNAGKIPLLRKYFSGEAQPIAVNVPASVTTTPDFGPAPENFVTASQENPYQTHTSSAQTAHEFSNDTFDQPLSATTTNACINHPDAPPTFICKCCTNLFCRECVKSFGAVKTCPLCGEMCEPFQTFQQKTATAYRRQQHFSKGFGFEDFGQALAYPFKYPLSLILGALFFSVLSFGGLFGALFANMILFGSISQTIGNIARGKLDANFLPDFEDFSIWDDVIHPWFLGVGVSLISWGPTVILLLALAYGMASSMINAQKEMLENQIKQSQETSESLRNNNEQVSPGNLTSEDMEALINGNNSQKSQEAAKKVEEMMRNSRKIEVERTKSEYEVIWMMLSPYLKAAIPIALALLTAILWGIFYYPIALAIAGYTRSFVSTINPVLGLSTIRQMGFTYFKAFLMYLFISFISLTAAMFVIILTAPFDMPFLGNLPAKFFNAILMFYFSIVTACVLGLAFYKSADKLDIPLD